MSLTVAQRLQRVKPSPTMAVSALASEMRAKGRPVIDLGAGEPDFDTPEHIKSAAIEAIRKGQTKYTPVEGTAALKTAIIEKFRRDNGLEYGPDQIVVSSGAKQTCYNVAMAVLNPGDEAIVPAPYWVSYPDMVKLADAEPVIVASTIEQRFKITPKALQAAITDKTRLLFLNSPSNPTGTAYTRAEWRALGDVLQHYPNVVIAADDMYEHIFWGKEPFCSIAAACPELYDRVVTINGVSKCYAMTGWRIGYAGGPRTIVAAMKKLQGQSTSNPCSISQAASVAALAGDQACVSEMNEAFRQRHEFITNALNGLPGFQCIRADGAFYAFPDVSEAIRKLGVADDIAFAELLLKKADVAVVPGSAFGAPGFIRLSFACSTDTLKEAVVRIGRILG
ncbi:MAG: pyridoxal phosphate-dependent aminotransferase [Gammaproteobacteria bacterium]|nr:MAG: pyridoxal phosphate-dependent aminotransferase [Gammaproteobacteria bacterium]